MDIDTLIFIIVFLAVVISNIKKILSEGKKKKGAEKKTQPEKTKKTDVLQRFVEKVVARIQEEIAPEPSEPSPGGKAKGKVSGWEALLGEGAAPSAPYEEDVVRDEDTDDVPLESEEAESEVSEIPDAIEDIILEPEPVISTEDQKGIERYPESTAPVYPVSELRRAVIWSEILGPPVALRED